MKLGIIDQSPILTGGTAAQALSESLRLARFADERGYHRFWFAEHHASAAFAGCAPEVMIGQALAATRRIRVGAGGVMLTHYSPYKVAETFKLLQTLYPGRIDLGIGRAPGSDGLTAAALAYGSRIGPEYFGAKLADLAAFLEDRVPHSEGLASVRCAPSVDTPPPLWMLGSSIDGAALAAQFALPYCHAHFIGPEHVNAAADRYLDGFQPDSTLAPGTGTRRPYLTLGVFMLCAPTAEEAAALARCRDLWRVRVERGEFLPFPSLEEAQAYRFSPAEQQRLEQRAQHQLVGTAEQVRDDLRQLARETQAQELMIISITPDYGTRERSYALLADAFDLPPGNT
ncbi:MAG: LLM class flavin-dependent oxidoreductase [Pseudomonadota bacterium]